MVVAASPRLLWDDAQKSTGSRFPIFNFPNIAHLSANDKDFSLHSK